MTPLCFKQKGGLTRKGPRQPAASSLTTKEEPVSVQTHLENNDLDGLLSEDEDDELVVTMEPLPADDVNEVETKVSAIRLAEKS